MASGESQKHLLSLIRNIASEKSQEELRVSDLKKRLLELQNDLNVANADLDGAKRSREMAEQELRGSQVQLSMIGASIQAQEARISLLQQEILKLRSDLDALNSEVGFMRDEFVKSMCELNKKIRQFQEITVNAFQMEQPGQLCSDNGFLKGLEDNIACLSTQMHELEAEYEKERHDRDKVCEELAHVERRWFLVTAIMEETKQLQELAEYPSWFYDYVNTHSKRMQKRNLPLHISECFPNYQKQTSELEKVYASLGEDLQKKCTCPGCGSNNIEDEGTEAT